MPGPSLNFQIATVVVYSFIAYLTIGMPLAVLPLEVSARLGFGSLVAGLVISAQYLATFLSRARAGRTIDTRGPKVAVCFGMLACGGSGFFLLLASLLPHRALLLVSLFVSRLLLGCGESFVGTGAILWGIGRVGPAHTARTISWNGVATYGALAVGAPLGVTLVRRWGFGALGTSVLIVAGLGLLLASLGRTVPTRPGEPLPMRHVLGQVWIYGVGLALGSIGFASIATFITLYYDGRHWPGAAWALTAFASVFVGVRLFVADQIGKRGGRQVAMVCFLIEGIGLGLLGGAGTPTIAFAAAVLSGIGFSLVFPALGVEAMTSVREDNRGAALAVYSLFIDVSLAVTGPLGGWLATRFPIRSVFFAAAAAAFGGFALAYRIPTTRTGSNPQ